MHLTYPGHDVERAGQASANEVAVTPPVGNAGDENADAGALAPASDVLTLDMILAGVNAYNSWNADDEEVAVLVISVYFAMCDARDAVAT